ncbi:hypothetical protein [Scytonema sp. NUACC26]
MNYNLIYWFGEPQLFLTGDNLEAALEIQAALYEYADIEVEVVENETR